MPDPHRLRRELLQYLSRPAYGALFHKINTFAKPGKAASTPESVADACANYLFQNHPLLDPVEVIELHGRTELYRVHDGGARQRSARTLGASWTERSVMETIWKGTAKYPPAERRTRFLEFLRTANFVLPEWNDMTYVVCMTVPAGASTLAVRGRGDWKAMKTPSGASRPGGAGSIRSAADVLREGMMPMPGLRQCFLPLVDDMWVQPVSPKSAIWPFAT